MQISDLARRYNNSVSTSSTESMTGTKGVERLVSSLSELSKGNIFEGTVNSVKGGNVKIALSNGTEISARLDGKLELAKGQSMFFQVKSNNGAQVEIRPYTIGEDGLKGNLTLMDALKAAGLPMEANLLSMVNSMMEENMSIGKDNVAAMARLVQDNPGINVSTIVSMSKLDIPVTAEMASQYENYLGDKQAINLAMDKFIDELPNVFSHGNLSADQLKEMGSQLLSIITEGIVGDEFNTLGVEEQLGNPEEIQTDGQLGNPGEALGESQLGNTQQVQMDGQLGNPQEALMESQLGNPQEAQAESQLGNSQEEQVDGQLGNPGEALAETQTEALAESQQKADSILMSGDNALGRILSDKQLAGLQDNLRELLIGLDESKQDSISNNLIDTITKNSNANQVLNQINQLMYANDSTSKSALSKLFSSNEFKALLRNAIEEQWTIKPKDISGSDKINRLYEHMENQLTKMEKAIKSTGADSTNISNLAAEIKNNVQFMNQINEAYSYVQIPLKMSGQNASGQLYVYTNKKALGDKEEDLTAFLHLDMDHLGPTDVSIRMKNKEVSANFYFDTDESYALVKQFLPELDAILKRKGYSCKLNIHNEEKHVNFVDNFLKKDKPSAGLLHRYSFDMRA